MHVKTVSKLIISLILTATVLGCSGPVTTREKGALLGTGVGAVTGAIVGSAVGNPGAGAALGGAVGLGAGALVGDQLQRREQVQYEQRRQIEQQQEQLDRQGRDLKHLEPQKEW